MQIDFSRAAVLFAELGLQEEETFKKAAYKASRLEKQRMLVRVAFPPVVICVRLPCCFIMIMLIFRAESYQQRVFNLQAGIKNTGHSQKKLTAAESESSENDSSASDGEPSLAEGHGKAAGGSTSVPKKTHRVPAVAENDDGSSSGGEELPLEPAVVAAVLASQRIVSVAASPVTAGGIAAAQTNEKAHPLTSPSASFAAVASKKPPPALAKHLAQMSAFMSAAGIGSASASAAPKPAPLAEHPSERKHVVSHQVVGDKRKRADDGLSSSDSDQLPVASKSPAAVTAGSAKQQPLVKKLESKDSGIGIKQEHEGPAIACGEEVVITPVVAERLGFSFGQAVRAELDRRRHRCDVCLFSDTWLSSLFSVFLGFLVCACESLFITSECIEFTSSVISRRTRYGCTSPASSSGIMARSLELTSMQKVLRTNWQSTLSEKLSVDLRL